MSQSQKRLPQTSLPDAFKAAGTKAPPLLSRAIDEKRFRDMLRILCSAVNHEVGGGINLLGNILMNENIAPPQNLGKAYRRIAGLANGIDETTKRYFTSEELEALVLVTDTGRMKYSHPNDSEAVRRLVLDDIPLLRSGVDDLIQRFSLIDLDATDYPEHGKARMRKQQERLPVYTKLLCDCLEQFLKGDLDLESEMVSLSSKKVEFILCKMVKLHAKMEAASTEEKAIRCNPIFIELICKNLSENAKRAMEGIETPSVSLTMRQEGDHMDFIFCDNGCGMDADTREKLNSGVRCSTKTDGGEHHGLGFQYSRALARKMGGDLYVKESAPGQGTTTVLSLPLA